MFIIYGTRTLKKILGIHQLETQCQHCNNFVLYSFMSAWRWVTIFFIPIFPIGRKKYYSMCPICSHGYTHTKEEIEAIPMTS